MDNLHADYYDESRHDDWCGYYCPEDERERRHEQLLRSQFPHLYAPTEERQAS